MNIDNQKPKINLKQHQRFKRQVPWGLIRKLVIVSILGGLMYYYIQNLNQNSANQQFDTIEVEIEKSRF